MWIGHRCEDGVLALLIAEERPAKTIPTAIFQGQGLQANRNSQLIEQIFIQFVIRVQKRFAF